MSDAKTKWCGCPRGCRQGHKKGAPARLYAAADRLGIDVAQMVRAMCERQGWRLYRLKDGSVRMARRSGREVER